MKILDEIKDCCPKVYAALKNWIEAEYEAFELSHYSLKDIVDRHDLYAFFYKKDLYPYAAPYLGVEKVYYVAVVYMKNTVDKRFSTFHEAENAAFMEAAKTLEKFLEKLKK